MSTEQERAKFEKWYLENTDVPHEAIKRKGAGYVWVGTNQAWEIWQAAQAALQSRYREDAERLDWLQQHDERFYNLLRITSIVNKGFSPTNNSGKQWFMSIREAIDHARRIEGGGE